jgi:PAS domain S-box-containing protein
MVPSHLWRLTPDGEPTFFNRRMVDFLELDVTDTDKPGMTRLEAMIEAAVHPDDAAAFEDTLRCSLATGMSFSMRYRLRRGDGVYRWMSSRAEPMRDQNGRIIQWYGLCHDIHDQMQADEALRRSQRQLQQMIDAVPVRIWSTPPAGGPVYFNKRYKDHLRSVVPDFDSIEEPRFDQLLQGLVHPVDAPAVWGALRNSFEAGEGCVLRFRWREKDGVYRWAECRVEPWCDQSGAIVQWYGVSLDIDDEVRAREALRRSERELSQLLDMVPVHIRRLTPEGEVTYFNKRTADFLGMDLAQLRRLGGGRALVTQQIQDFIHPDDAASLLETVCRALAAGEGWVARYRLRRTDGVYRWVEGRAEPLREQDGAISQYFTATIDIDDYMRVQQAEDALRQASAKLALATRSASLAELSASIAHEVNQPLAAIVANSHACHRWLSAESPNIDRAKVTLERIIRDANAAADVVTRIRALFRHVPHAKSPEDVNRLIGEVCRLMADEIRAKDIRVRTSLDPDLPTVALDRVQVQQVLVNLIRNGIEAMDGVIERALEICSCRDGIDAVRIEVRDAGTGFGDLERAFEPFFTTKESGMGMGLPICRSIVESHGGRLWVANNEARGATVAFALPLAASEAP